MKKEINGTPIKNIRNLYRPKKEKAIKNRAIRDIRNVFEHEEEENYYKPVTVGNFWSNNYIGYKSNSDSNKTLSIDKYLNKIRPYLKDVNNLKKSDKWKIRSIIAINFICFIDNNDEEHACNTFKTS